MRYRRATYCASGFRDLFSRCRLYQAQDNLFPGIRESGPVIEGEHLFAERHLQCIWFDPRLRPDGLRTVENETVEVEHPGTWNLEAGPDFKGAAIRIGSSRRIQGDAEIHIHPRDWIQHGHNHDPRYDNVRIHVTFHRPSGNKNLQLPAGTIQIVLQKPLQINPLFSFEQIDLSAYPYAARAQDTACSRLLRSLSADGQTAILQAAGEERLRRKTLRFADLLETMDSEQLLYQELFSALGYKHNRLPFRELADRVPAARLREESGNNAMTAYAILLGNAGLLPDDLPGKNTQAQQFVRKIWDIWWKERDKWMENELQPLSWQLGGLRPANHPSRRLMAAAHLFTQPLPLSEQLTKLTKNSAKMVKLLIELLTRPTGTFWDHHLSLNGRTHEKASAIIGTNRAAAIITNICIPWLAAQNLLPNDNAPLLNSLGGGTLDSTARMTAHNLFGRDHNPKLYRSGLCRQGLLQIFRDFCIQDRSNCGNCGFPDIIKQNLS